MCIVDAHLSILKRNRFLRLVKKLRNKRVIRWEKTAEKVS